MILDSSALVAIAMDEPERAALLAKMDTADVIAGADVFFFEFFFGFVAVFCE